MWINIIFTRLYYGLCDEAATTGSFQETLSRTPSVHYWLLLYIKILNKVKGCWREIKQNKKNTLNCKVTVYQAEHCFTEFLHFSLNVSSQFMARLFKNHDEPWKHASVTQERLFILIQTKHNHDFFFLMNMNLQFFSSSRKVTTTKYIVQKLMGSAENSCSTLCCGFFAVIYFMFIWLYPMMHLNSHSNSWKSILSLSKRWDFNQTIWLILTCQYLQLSEEFQVWSPLHYAFALNR